jgi:hypothetical protein
LRFCPEVNLMKKLLILALLSHVAFGQTIEHKTPPVSSGSLAPIAAGTILGNSTGSTAAPGAVPAGALTFTGGALSLRDTVSLLDYSPSAAPSGIAPVNVSTTNGSGTVNISSTPLVVGVVGDTITIVDRVGNNGNIYTGTITARNSSTQVVVSPTVGFTVSSGSAWWGPDQTTAFAAAWAAASAANKCLYVPAGNYFYNAAGLSGWATPCVIGDGAGQTNIFVTTGNYFIDGNEFWGSAQINKMAFYGGLGAVRNRYASQNVDNGPIDIQDDNFNYYSNAAITFNSSDQTNHSIERDSFQGLWSAQSIGVAIACSDFGWIDHNSFGQNVIDIKIGCAAQAAHIENNDFGMVHAEATPGSYVRAAININPSGGTSKTSGYAAVIAHNKFGPENLDVSDVRILLADSLTYNGTTTFYGDVLWSTTASVNSVSNITFVDNSVYSLAGHNPLFYSYTPYFYMNRVSAECVGTCPVYILDFDASVTVAEDANAVSNIMGPFTTLGFGTTYAGTTISNIPNWGAVMDPTGDWSLSDPTVPTPFLSGTGSTTPLVSQSWVTQAPTLGNVTAANISPDPIGGTDAVTVTTTGTSGYRIKFNLSSSPAAGTLFWFDFWARQGSSGTPATSTAVLAQNAALNSGPLQKPIPLSVGWTHYKIPIIPRTGTVANVQFFAPSSVASTTIDFALVRAYAAQEPAAGGFFINPITLPLSGILKGNGATTEVSAALAADVYALWSGACSSSTFLRGDGACAAAAAVPAFATPSGSIGLTAVAGSATTVPRSDGSNALSQAIVPTWTGVHTFSATPVFSAGETLTNAANSYTQTSTGLSLTSGTTGFGRNITGTVADASAVDGIIDFANITCTTCTATSYLVDWQVGGSSKFKVDTAGNLTLPSNAIANGFVVAAAGTIVWTGRGALSSAGAGQVQLGAANAASPVNQTLLTQGARGGTDTNVAGANVAIQSGLGTGNAAGSTLSLQTPHTGSTGTTLQTANTQILLGDNTVAMANLASSSAATTGTVCWTTGGNLTVDTTVACLASLGAWKEQIEPLDGALSEILQLRPVSYQLKPEFNPEHLGRQMGFLAEDVEKIDTRLVGYGGDGKLRGVRYMQMTALLTEGEKELHRTIQRQQWEIYGLAVWCFGLSAAFVIRRRTSSHAPTRAKG